MNSADLVRHTERAVVFSNLGPFLPSAQVNILEKKCLKRKCEPTVIYHVAFRQKKISKRTFNLHAPF